MLSQQEIYRRLPLPLQHAAVGAVGLTTRLDRYGRDFRRTLAAARDRTYTGGDELRAFSAERLRAHLRRAQATTPYYASLFAELGFDPCKPDFVESFERRIPVLDKETILRQPAAFLARGIAAGDRVVQNTSGTTGQGLRFVATRQALREQWAMWWRFLEWHGVRYGTWCAYFIEKALVERMQTRPPFWRYNLPARQVLFSTQHLKPENMPAYVGELRRRRLRWLHGYPSALALLAEHINSTGTDLGYQVRHVTTASENLLIHQREAITQAFGVVPRQHYAMTEAVANASECERGSLHIDEDFAFVESIPDQATGDQRIVGTNFTNPAFPLIRYSTCDVVEIGGSCDCGRQGRIVRVDGRQEDYVVLADGTRLGRLDHIFKNATAVREAQIVQQRAGSVTIRLVPSERFTREDEQAIVAQTRRRIGHDTALHLEYVQAIPRTASGKLRLVVSEVGRLSR